MTTYDVPLSRVDLRFYADLTELSGEAERSVPIGTPRSVKDVIEACGVPHTEVGLVVVDREPVGFDHRVGGGERIAAYPPFHHLELGATTTVLPPPVPPRFVLDVHLGTLTRRLRLLGFDAWYRTDTDDHELATRAVDEHRILLTRDRQLLMRRAITHGYCPRSDDPERQAVEVVRRYDLGGVLAPFTRCVRCNGPLRPAARAEVVDLVPPLTREVFDTFTRCTACGQVYWPGTHRDAVAAFIARAAASGRSRRPA